MQQTQALPSDGHRSLVSSLNKMALVIASFTSCLQGAVADG